jgi:hydrogenase nickel incorporation protein HypB
MCAKCGCSEHEVAMDSQRLRANSHHPEHHHDHDRCTHGALHSHVNLHGEEGVRILKLGASVFEENVKYAEQNRRYLRERSVRMLNLVSSPGAGKTTLLARSIGDLKDHLTISVIEGDQQTSRDAERIATTGVAVVQINTGKACHLDAQMVGRALKELDIANGSILFVENVGNLICPAEFDLGEEKRVVVISVTEGDDKPLKYPSIFASSDLMIVTKIDLSPHVDFDCEACIRYAKRLKPSIKVIRTSAKTGEGLAQWYDWLSGRLSLNRDYLKPPESG